MARYPILLAGLLWGWPIDQWMLGDRRRTVIAIGALALLPLSVAVFAAPVRRHRALAAMAAGGALALVPLTATFPATRLLLLPGIVGALVVGTYLAEAWPPHAAGWLRAAIATVLALRHVVLAPVLLVASILLLGVIFRESREEVLDSPWPPDLDRHAVALLNAPHFLSAAMLQPLLAVHHRPTPPVVWVLSASPYPAAVTRTGPATLELRLRCGEMLTTDFERLLRRSPLARGATVDTAAFRATVTETGRGGPTAVRFDFTGDLDAGPLLVRWSRGRYRPQATPPIGGVIVLPAVAQGFGSVRAPAPTCAPG